MTKRKLADSFTFHAFPICQAFLHPCQVPLATQKKKKPCLFATARTLIRRVCRVLTPQPWSTGKKRMKINIKIQQSKSKSKVRYSHNRHKIPGHRARRNSGMPERHLEPVICCRCDAALAGYYRCNMLEIEEIKSLLQRRNGLEKVRKYPPSAVTRDLA